jgi:molecular chaperone GrpE
MKSQPKPKFKKEYGVSLKELKNQLARALADYDNLKKRVERERQELSQLAGLGLIVRLLPVLDNLEQAQKHLQDAGLAISLNEFNEVLKEEGVEKVEAAPGMKFDENLHEAIEIISASGSEGRKKGEIAEVVLPGWRYKDGPVIRVAKVKVYGQKSGKEQELEKEMARGEYT